MHYVKDCIAERPLDKEWRPQLIDISVNKSIIHKKKKTGNKYGL